MADHRKTPMGVTSKPPLEEIVMIQQQQIKELREGINKIAQHIFRRNVV